MSKILNLILAISLVSVATSCTKDTSVKPAKAKTSIVADKSELGVGD